MESPPAPARSPPWPWATALVSVAAMLIFSSSKASELFIYQRPLIFGGQIWRIWTGHLVHFGSSHLAWDLAVFLPAGCWLETLRPRAARWFYLCSPPVISLVLLAFDPHLERYAGLSGLAIGVLGLLALVQLGGRDSPPWLWRAVLLLIATKLVLEMVKGSPLLVSDFQNIRNVPLAHFAGLGCGLVCWWVLGRPRPESPPPAA